MNTKICEKCKKTISDSAIFCNNCGTPIEKESSNPVNASNQKKDRALSISGFVCSLVGYITCGLTSIAGLILSIVGLAKSKKSGEKDGLAIAGIVLSSIPILYFWSAFTIGFFEGLTAKEVKMVDFSVMEKEEISKWCSDNKITCNHKEEYSDTVPKGKYIGQEVEAGKTIKEHDSVDIIYSKGEKSSSKQERAKTKIELESKEVNIGTGESVTINYTIEPNDIEIKKIEWKSSNSSIATVENGVVTGIKDGSAIISLTINGTSEKITINVTRTYTPVYIDTMEDELNNNAAATKEKYNGMYVEVTGRLGTIDSDLKYFGLYSISNKWDLTGIFCRIKKIEVRDTVKTLTKGQTITVRGKITDVGEVLGFYMDVDEIITQ